MRYALRTEKSLFDVVDQIWRSFIESALSGMPSIISA